MDNEIKMHPIPFTRAPQLPRYPNWRITITEFGCTRETEMTQQEFNEWQMSRWGYR